MLPAFHIRDTVEELGEIQLAAPEEYDELIVEHPVATLGYVDDDDGEVITVGSSTELYDRIDELQSLRPIVFDLLTSLRSWPQAPNTAEGIRVWREYVERNYKRKGKEPVRPATETELLVDVSDGPTPTPQPEPEPKPKVEPEEQKPFLTAFEEELKKLLENQTTEGEAAPAPAASHYFEPFPPQPAAPITPADIVAQAIQSISWASHNILRLRQDLPSRAQPAVESLSQAVHSAMGALTVQLSQIAQDASEKAHRAANATRDVDTAEIEAIREKIRYLAVGIGHVAAQSAGAVAGVAAVEARKAAEIARKEVLKEVNKAKEEIGKNVQEAVRGFSGQYGGSSTTKGKEAEVKEAEVKEAEVKEAEVKEAEVKEADVTDDSQQQQQQEEEEGGEKRQEQQQEEQQDEAKAEAEAEDDRELYEAPSPRRISTSSPEFTPTSQYKSCADWIKDVKEQNAKMAQLSDQSKEQEAVAFWQQMDRIAHYTTECSQPGTSANAAAPTAEEPKESEAKEADEQDQASMSSLSDDDGDVRGEAGFNRRHHFGGMRQRSRFGRFRDETGVEHRRRPVSRRHHGGPHLPHGHRHFSGPRHHPRGPPPPPPPPHPPLTHYPPPPLPPPHAGIPFPPPPPLSPPRNGNHRIPQPPSPPSPPGFGFPPDFPSFDGFHGGPSPAPPPLHSNFPYPPPPPPPGPLSHPHGQFRLFGSSNAGSSIDGGSDIFRHSFVGTPAEAAAVDGSNWRTNLLLRRSRTVTGSSYHPPPAPFHGPIDLSRSISPAPTMPPLPSWNTVEQEVDITDMNADPFATPPRAPSPEEPEEPFVDAQEPVVAPPPPPLSAFPFNAFTTPVLQNLSDRLSSQRSVVDSNPCSLPGAFPREEREGEKGEENEAIDRCVASMMEMGYGGDAEDEVERLRVYAQIVNGDVEAAIDLLEEEKGAWEGR